MKNLWLKIDEKIKFSFFEIWYFLKKFPSLANLQSSPNILNLKIFKASSRSTFASHFTHSSIWHSIDSIQFTHGRSSYDNIFSLEHFMHAHSAPCCVPQLPNLENRLLKNIEGLITISRSMSPILLENGRKASLFMRKIPFIVLFGVT
jgi:hypothetical protein